MDKIKKLNQELDLVYFEYDALQNRFIADKNVDEKRRYHEFIKLTYYLSKNSISFFIDDESNLVLEQKDTFLAHISRFIKNKLFHLKSNQKNIYILSDTYVQHAKNLPVIQTTPIQKEIDFSLYDAIIFTSKNAIKAIDSMNYDWKKLPCYAISNKTAKVIKDHGGKVAFISKEKHGNEFASELILQLQSKKVIFLGAKKVVADLTDILNNNGVTCDHVPIYETTCIQYEEKINLPKNSIVIFSSPSTIECFFQNVHWDESFQAISIGKTTAQYFPEYITPIISDQTSLQNCVQIALNLP